MPIILAVVGPVGAVHVAVAIAAGSILPSPVTLFILELAYAALVRLTNIPEEAIQPMLLIQAPFLMYPFARRIMSDMVRDGGMPPLMIEPIDFGSLYRARMSEAQQLRAGQPS